MVVWGNHSATMFVDHRFSAVQDSNNPNKLTPIYKVDKAAEKLSDEWVQKIFVPSVQQRGTKVMEQRGNSSGMSAASAIGDHIKDWLYAPSLAGEYVSMGVVSDGSYGITKGIVFSFPVTCKNGEYSIVKGLELNEFAKQMLAKTEKELLEEKATVESFQHQ